MHLQAIKNGQLEILKQKVRKLTREDQLVVYEELESEWCPKTLVECAGGYFSPKEREKQPYHMTLLAYAGYHGRIDMINLLLPKEASE